MERGPALTAESFPLGSVDVCIQDRGPQFAGPTVPLTESTAADCGEVPATASVAEAPTAAPRRSFQPSASGDRFASRRSPPSVPQPWGGGAYRPAPPPHIFGVHDESFEALRHKHKRHQAKGRLAGRDLGAEPHPIARR
jgi:hypothetical protein